MITIREVMIHERHEERKESVGYENMLNYLNKFSDKELEYLEICCKIKIKNSGDMKQVTIMSLLLSIFATLVAWIDSLPDAKKNLPAYVDVFLSVGYGAIAIVMVVAIVSIVTFLIQFRSKKYEKLLETIHKVQHYREKSIKRLLW